MNILKFLEVLASDNLTHATPFTRRESLERFGNFSKKVALASVPFGLSALANKSSAQDIGPTPATPIGALQFALTLEYLEATFYAMGNESGVIPAADQAIFTSIGTHESHHVTFLQNALGANSVTSPTFDFTVGGAFNPFGDYPTFLALAQAFEDTGVRAYKGQAGNLISTPDYLTAALQIHSVEARHASQVRRLRGLKGWIQGNIRGAGMPDATQATYDGEDNVNQAGFNTSTVTDSLAGGTIPAIAGSESFDEILTTEQVVAIANLFIV